MAIEFNDSYYLRVGQAGDRPALRFYARLACSYIRKGRILDFGCGTGFFLRRLSGHFQVDGFDISEYARQASHHLVPHADLYSRLGDLPLSTYTGITSLHVLEHMTDEELKGVLQAWKRSLKDGGRVICVVPDATGRGHRTKGREWFGYRDPSHINLKGSKEWLELFADNGFRVEQIGTDGMWDFPYVKGVPRLLDAAINSTGTVIQYLSGVLLLAEGAGESAIFVMSPEPG